MKNIKSINEFLKIYENHISPLFKNESELKKRLMVNSDFADSDVFQAIVNVIHDEWQQHDVFSYDDILEWTDKNFGAIPLFSMYLAKYSYQVDNGGHSQYFSNGYASSQTSGYGSNYDNIDNHETFVELFNDLGFKTLLPSGEKVYKIISDFELDLEDEVESCDNCGGEGYADCAECNGDGTVECEECNGSGEVDDEECSNCSGDGTIDCPECNGRGRDRCGDCDGDGEIQTGNRVPNYTSWSNLDDRWYKISSDFLKEYENYIKSLTLDGEKIEDLIELANKTQRYNL